MSLLAHCANRTAEMADAADRDAVPVSGDYDQVVKTLNASDPRGKQPTRRRRDTLKHVHTGRS
jgi:hypothetical protein